MKTLSIISVCGLLLVSGVSSAQHIENGKLVFPERRINSYVYDGVSRDVIEVVSSRITGF